MCVAQLNVSASTPLMAGTIISGLPCLQDPGPGALAGSARIINAEPPRVRVWPAGHSIRGVTFAGGGRLATTHECITATCMGSRVGCRDRPGFLPGPEFVRHRNSRRCIHQWLRGGPRLLKSSSANAEATRSHKGAGSMPASSVLSVPRTGRRGVSICRNVARCLRTHSSHRHA